MRNYPAAFYSSAGPTRAVPGPGRGAAADGSHALRAGVPVPFAIVGAYIEADEMRRFGEREVEELGSERMMGWERMGWMVG